MNSLNDYGLVITGMEWTLIRIPSANALRFDKKL